MDDRERTESLIRRNRALLARAAAVCQAAQEVVGTAKQALRAVELQKIDRKRRRALRNRSLGSCR